MSKLLIIAGEVSGDMYAAALIGALKRQNPGLTFHGIGGDACQTEGMEIFHHAEEMTIIGLTEIAKRYPFLKRVMQELTDWVARERPAAIILIDYPGFNLRFAQRVKSLHVPVVYYVCPQVWAWHRSRISQLAAAVNHLITIFPFEAAHFSGTGLQVTFAGHPLVDEAAAAHALPRADIPWQGTRRVALLPGSRRVEITHNLPVMLEAARRLEQRYPDIAFIIAAPSEREGRYTEQILSAQGARAPKRVNLVCGQTREVLRQAESALVASGTATIEAALMGCPMVIVYKVAMLTYLLASIVVRVRFLGMVNIIAGRAICPELIQYRASPQRIVNALDPLLNETPARAEMLAALNDVRASLGTGGAHERAAAAVLQTIAANASLKRLPAGISGESLPA